MAFTGKDVIDIGSTRIGQRYVLGAMVPLDNPNWRGPWDCAEFASWCTYQAYGLIFGAGTTTSVAKAEPYSGSWFVDARKRGTAIPWREALEIEGAALIRAPSPGRIGHVAFAIGDGVHTLEARGAQFGVGRFAGAATRTWSLGCLLPGVDYGAEAAQLADQPLGTQSFPTGYLWLRRPRFKGPDVVALQRALDAAGIDPGPNDGDFGRQVRAALIALQIVKGVEVDGVFGPTSARLLGLAFPIVPTPADIGAFTALRAPAAPARVPVPPAAPPVDTIAAVDPVGTSYRARTVGGFSFLVGSSVPYTDDMNRLGLKQRRPEIADSLQFGVYRAADFAAAQGQWAHFIEPTLNAEGGARFATLNTYDRAAFTFGAPQFAAHTPRANFVEYLRRLLAFPNANWHFPDLSLRANAQGRMTIHLARGAAFLDLEQEVEVLRPNGKREVQLPHLMAYLNPSPVAIDTAELVAAARLMNWLRIDPATRSLQVTLFIDSCKALLRTAKTKVRGFDGRDWQAALWIMDLRHQNRGSYPEIDRAFAASGVAGLRKIGQDRFPSRVASVIASETALVASGVMTGFTV